MSKFKVTYTYHATAEVTAKSPEDAHKKVAKADHLNIGTVSVLIEDIEMKKAYRCTLQRRRGKSSDH